MWHRGKGSINHQVCFGRDPGTGLGALHAEGSGWDGDSTHTASPSQNPAYQMRMVMTRTAARMKKAKIPRDTRTAIFSKGSLRSGTERLSQLRDATVPSTWGTLWQAPGHSSSLATLRYGARDPSHCSQPHTQHSCPLPRALLTDGLRVGSLGRLLSQVLQSGICSGFFSCCGGQVWKDRRDGNTHQKHMQHPRNPQRGTWKGIFVPQRSHEPKGATEVLKVLWRPHSVPSLWEAIPKWISTAVD